MIVLRIFRELKISMAMNIDYSGYTVNQTIRGNILVKLDSNCIANSWEMDRVSYSKHTIAPDVKALDEYFDMQFHLALLHNNHICNSTRTSVCIGICVCYKVSS